jgi:hypothetical protein
MFGRNSVERKKEVQRPDGDYFLQRAEAEIGLAQRATHPRVVAVHFQLAEAYLDRVYGTEAVRDEAEAKPSKGRSSASSERWAA